MIDVVSYDAAGNLHTWGACQEGNQHLLALEGLTVLLGVGTDHTHYVQAGVLVPYTTLQAANKYVYPAYPCRWDNTLMAWIDLRTLEEIKATKNQQINAARLLANQTVFTFIGQDISVDTLSRGDIDGTNGTVLLTGAMPPNWQGGWKTVANTYVAIPDVATWTQFYLAMNNQGSINFNHAQELKARLSAATTIEEVEAIVW